jgi:hypothetical protein
MLADIPRKKNAYQVHHNNQVGGYIIMISEARIAERKYMGSDCSHVL